MRIPVAIQLEMLVHLIDGRLELEGELKGIEVKNARIIERPRVRRGAGDKSSAGVAADSVKPVASS